MNGYELARTSIDLILVALKRYECLVSKSFDFLKIGWRTKELWALETS